MDFSIIVPTYGRPAHLSSCLRWIARLDYSSRAFEILVVDDGSPEGLDPLLQDSFGNLNLRLLRQSRGGPASARNLGADAARGRFLAFIDDDCRPSKKWLQTIAQSFESHPRAMVGGHTINRLSNNPFSTVSQLIVDVIYKHFNVRESPVGFFTSNNLAVPADQFREIGGFDHRFSLAAAEDRELCDRWLASGYHLQYQPQAVMYHVHKLGVRSFLQQHFNYGRGARLYHLIRSQRGHKLLRVDLELHDRLLRCLFAPMPGRSARWQAQLTAGIILSQLAYIAGFAHARLRTHRQIADTNEGEWHCNRETSRTAPLSRES